MTTKHTRTKAKPSKQNAEWSIRPLVYLLRSGGDALEAPGVKRPASESLFLSEIRTVIENWWRAQRIIKGVFGWLQFECKTDRAKRPVPTASIGALESAVLEILTKVVGRPGIDQSLRWTSDRGYCLFRGTYLPLPASNPEKTHDNASEAPYARPMPPPESTPDLRQIHALIEPLFAGLPADPADRLLAMGDRIDLFRLRARQELEPALNGYLQTLEGHTADQNAAVAEVVNGHLRPLGLRLIFQERESTLHFLAASKKNPYGRFMIVPVGESVASFSTSSLEKLATAISPVRVGDPYPTHPRPK